jgi:elongation factor P
LTTRVGRQAQAPGSATFREVFVASIEYSQVRKGMVIVGEDGQLYTVVDRDLNTPGNWRAILQLKLKNLNTGSITVNRVRPQDKVEQAYLDKREMQYLYKDGDSFVFMDNETYDQYHLENEMVGEMMQYLKENDKVHVIMYEGKAISVEPPATVNLKVVNTEPSVKGATAAAQYKPATLETGFKVTVPPFINIGDVVAVDTRTGEYLGRAKE